MPERPPTRAAIRRWFRKFQRAGWVEAYAAKVEALATALEVALPKLVDAAKVELSKFAADLPDVVWEAFKREEDERRAGKRSGTHSG